ncbi:hypothetical protein [Azospirillum picis]|uniref:Uncharacterized protein n=1 Tax=Azospirillum picis TaxID=488438 RepID=A0ABU0MST8_9PROT|nr:hypothetical protein [Azospirillum picis]MBP2302811.1 hypothetical protein [Azospirillum picis]MDQ0536527.1 hypothetical protein [Azospirillum picis]
MLDDERKAAVKEAMASLPLTERQRELADETLEDMTPENADRIIAAHRKLIEKLPAALLAIRAVRGR